MQGDNDWSELQGIIKNQVLGNITVNAKEKELSDELKKYLSSYYKIKIKNLLVQENNLKKLGIIPMQDSAIKIKISINEGENSLPFYESIKAYLFEFRNNTELLKHFISSITADEQTVVAKVLVHFFFEDIKINESSCLLEKTIDIFLEDEMNVPDFFVDTFPSDTKFLKKLFHEILNRNEVKVHIKSVLSSVIHEMDKHVANLREGYVTFNIRELSSMVTSSLNSKNNNFEVFDNTLMDLRQSTPGPQRRSDFNNPFQASRTLAKNYGFTVDKTLTMTRNIFGLGNQKTLINLKSAQIESNLYSNLIEVKDKNLRHSLKSETNEFMKAFYVKHINNLAGKKKDDIYSFNSFRTSFAALQNYEKTAELYSKNFEIVKSLISKILHNIQDNIPFVPKIIKHIMQAINDRLRKKYPNIDELTVDCYLTKFYIETLILPTIAYPEMNEFIVSSLFLSKNTRQSLLTLATIFKSLSRCELFSSEDRSNYVIFNTFIIQNVPKINEIIQGILGSNVQIFNETNNKEENNQDIYQVLCLTKKEIYLFVQRFKGCSHYLKEPNKYFQMIENQKTIFSDVTSPDMVNKELKVTYTLFLNLNLNEERKNCLSIQEKKEIIPFYQSSSGFVEEVKICIKHVLSNIPELSSTTNFQVEMLFKSLHEMINHHDKDYNKNQLSQIPLNWYSQYIITKLPELPENYKENNYTLLYNELKNETEDQCVKLGNKNGLLVTQITEETNSLKKIQGLAKYQYSQIKEFELTIKMRDFANFAKIEVCLLNGNEQCDVIFNNNIQKKINSEEYINNVSTKELILKTQNDCVHSTVKKMNSLSLNLGMNNNKKEESNEISIKATHCNNVESFIQRISKYREDIINDIFNSTSLNIEGKRKENDITRANEVLDQYFDYISDYIEISEYKKMISSDKNKEKKEKFMDKLQNYVKTKISINLSIKQEQFDKENKKFTQKCKSLQWIDPVVNMKISPKAINDYQMEIATNYLKKMDSEIFCDNIIEMLGKAIDTIVKMYKFSLSNEGATLDDFAPIICYLLIKIQPQKMISNFGNCQYFIQEKKKNQNLGYNLASMEVFINYINSIDHVKCGMENDEKKYLQLCKESKGSI